MTPTKTGFRLKHFLTGLGVAELYREGSVSLGRAAELCGVSQAEFMQFAAEREVALHYTLADLEQDREFIESLPS